MFGDNTVTIAVITFLAFLVEGSGGVQEEDLDVGDVRVYLDNFASESTDYVYYIEKDFDYFYNLEMMKILESNSLDDSFVDKELDNPL